MNKPTIEELQAQVKQLAAENAALKSGYMFFMYSDDAGFETYKTREEAIKAAQEMIDLCREDAYDGWPEETDNIRWGVVIQQATETDFKKPAPENGWEGSSDYKLLPETPATDAIIAYLRAEGVEMLAAIASNECKRYKSINDRAGLRKWKSIVILCSDFAAQLRSKSEVQHD
ncbi:hypothetical protein [Kosakonia cowanii]|uniref:hypothetical protein n=1 Tax=Kosakonia cowanii TaxID=208223 RepID=UPI0040628EEB